jgi:TetR/AcrR family transcriptional regulator, ethionamide resistance regulator
LRSTARTVRPRLERRDELLRVLSTAVERLLESGLGYGEISVERLCQEAGISRPTFYLYFESKRELLSDLAEATLGEFGKSIAFWAALPVGKGPEDLVASFRQTFELYTEHQGVMKSLSETGAHDQAMRERLHSIVGSVIENAAAKIAHGIADGSVDPDLDPQTDAPWLCWMLERGLYDITVNPNEHEIDEMLTAITMLIWNALYRDVR